MSMLHRVESCLDDKFQEEWLIPGGFLKVIEGNVEEIGFNKNIVSKDNMEILQELGNHEKHIVSAAKISRIIFGNSEPRALKYTQLRMDYLQRIMEDPSVLLHAKRIGYVLGGLELNVHAADIVLMHYFWEHPEVRIASKTITRETGISRDGIISRVYVWRNREDYGDVFSVEGFLDQKNGINRGYRFVRTVQRGAMVS